MQTYDDYPVISMMQFEDLGFCGKGEARGFVRERDLTVGGDLPHNTSGGQLSAGQAGAAGGYLGLVEALRQVTGQAGPTQVEGARRALVSGFGMINYDRGVCSARGPDRGGRMTDPLAPPPKKNPQAPSGCPRCRPPPRSRAALGLTAAAAEGRFMLQHCAACGAVQYPPRDACCALPFDRSAVARHRPGRGRLSPRRRCGVSPDLYFRARRRGAPGRCGSTPGRR